MLILFLVIVQFASTILMGYSLYQMGRLDIQMDSLLAMSYMLTKLRNAMEKATNDREVTNIQHEALMEISDVLFDKKKLKQYAALQKESKKSRKETHGTSGSGQDFNQT